MEGHEYRGRGRCSLCHKAGVHVFEAGIGDCVVTHCPVCNCECALNARSRAGRVCETCKGRLEFPDLGNGAMLTCYACHAADVPSRAFAVIREFVAH